MKNKTLKTLKDLEKEQEEYDESYTIVGVDKLRQVAIKWVKWKLSNNLKLNIEKITWSNGKVIIDWKGDKDLFTVGFCTSLIEFNNITEEDLI